MTKTAANPLQERQERDCKQQNEADAHAQIRACDGEGTGRDQK